MALLLSRPDFYGAKPYGAKPYGAKPCSTSAWSQALEILVAHHSVSREDAAAARTAAKDARAAAAAAEAKAAEDEADLERQDLAAAAAAGLLGVGHEDGPFADISTSYDGDAARNGSSSSSLPVLQGGNQLAGVAHYCATAGVAGPSKQPEAVATTGQSTGTKGGLGVSKGVTLPVTNNMKAATGGKQAMAAAAAGQTRGAGSRHAKQPTSSKAVSHQAAVHVAKGCEAPAMDDVSRRRGTVADTARGCTGAKAGSSGHAGKGGAGKQAAAEGKGQGSRPKADHDKAANSSKSSKIQNPKPGCKEAWEHVKACLPSFRMARAERALKVRIQIKLKFARELWDRFSMMHSAVLGCTA